MTHKGKIKILLLMPDGHIHKIKIGRFTRSMREAPLTLTTLAALTPANSLFDLRLVDENVEPIPLGEPADIVGISVLTGTAPRAYQLADHFRSKGATVVLGGVHVTLLPEEARQHADSIVIGPAESSWPAFLEDYENGSYKEIYKASPADGAVFLKNALPRRDLQRSLAYNIPNTINATRGCQQTCDFCSVPAVWPGYHKRPVADIVDEIRQTPGRLLAFNDVSLIDDVEHAKELFTAMIPLKRRWGGLTTVKIANHPELIELMRKSGCCYLLIGFESVNQNSLKEIHKGFNRQQRYKELISHLHDRGITVQGCFIFGFDHDDQDVFDSTVQQVVELNVDIPRYSILTPYPGTPLYRRLTAQDRILSHNWEDYDTMHVVFRPLQMTPEELYSGFKSAYRETFRIGRILSRTNSFTFTSVINFVGNLTYKRFVRQLYTNERYARPFHPEIIEPTPHEGITPEGDLCLT